MEQVANAALAISIFGILYWGGVILFSMIAKKAWPHTDPATYEPAVRFVSGIGATLAIGGALVFILVTYL